MKKFLKLKLTAFFLCVLVSVPMMFACGEKPADTGSSTSANDTTPEPVQEPATTAEPTTTTEAPTTTTEEPTTWEPIDPSLPYWEQIEIELSRYGLTGGAKILAGDTETDLMKKFTANAAKKQELDVSGDNVPFSAAYSVNVAKDTENFWDASYSANLMKDVAIEQDDLIVGVIWVKGGRVAESEKFMADDPAQYYLALKTATDNWGTEGDMTPAGIMEVQEGWQKIFFCGRIINEETNSSNINFQIFIGYGIQEIDFGGIYAMRFPSTTENEKAIWKFIG